MHVQSIDQDKTTIELYNSDKRRCYRSPNIICR